MVDDGSVTIQKLHETKEKRLSVVQRSSRVDLGLSARLGGVNSCRVFQPSTTTTNDVEIRVSVDNINLNILVKRVQTVVSAHIYCYLESEEPNIVGQRLLPLYKSTCYSCLSFAPKYEVEEILVRFYFIHSHSR